MALLKPLEIFTALETGNTSKLIIPKSLVKLYNLSLLSFFKYKKFHICVIRELSYKLHKMSFSTLSY